MSADYSTQSNTTEASASPLPVSTPSAAANDDKTVAILAYCTGLGFIVAIVLFLNGKKSELAAFHLRQVLGIIAASFAFSILSVALGFIPFVGWLGMMLGWLAILALVVLGFIGALNGRQTPVPVVGEQFQKWFATVFTT